MLPVRGYASDPRPILILSVTDDNLPTFAGVDTPCSAEEQQPRHTRYSPAKPGHLPAAEEIHASALAVFSPSSTFATRAPIGERDPPLYPRLEGERKGCRCKAEAPSAQPGYGTFLTWEMGWGELSLAVYVEKTR